MVTKSSSRTWRHIFLTVDVPGAGVADHVTVLRFYEQRAFPERLRERRKAQRGEEPLAVLHHLQRRGVLVLQQLGQVVALVGISRRDQGIDVAPLLPPHI